MICPEVLKTNDIAELQNDRFRILGRKDNVVCSGGLKIQIEEVERLLQQHTDTELMVSKCEDEQLGETLVLITAHTNAEALRPLCQKVLPRYWQPRYYMTVDALPKTATGKPARKEAERLISRLRDQASSE